MVHTGPRQPSATDWVQTIAQIQMASQTAQIAEAQRQQLAHQAQQVRIEEERRQRRIRQQVEMNWLVGTDELLSKFPDVSNWYSVGNVQASKSNLFKLLVPYIDKFERQRIHEIFEDIENIKFARKVMTSQQSLIEGLSKKLSPEVARDVRSQSEMYLNATQEGMFERVPLLTLLESYRAIPILLNLKRDITKEKNDLPSNVSELKSKMRLKISQRDEIISGSTYTNKIGASRLLIMLAGASLFVGNSSFGESLPISGIQANYISGISFVFALILTQDAKLNSVNKEILKLDSDEKELSQRIEEMEQEYDDLLASIHRAFQSSPSLAQSQGPGGSPYVSHFFVDVESLEELIILLRWFMNSFEDIVYYSSVSGGVHPDSGFSAILEEAKRCMPPE